MRRNWAEDGITLIGWQLNLDTGIKAYLVRIIPMVFGIETVLWLGLGYKDLPGGAIVALTEIIVIAIMLWALNCQNEIKAITSARNNVITMILLLFFPLSRLSSGSSSVPGSGRNSSGAVTFNHG
jgi:hypothetical protein